MSMSLSLFASELRRARQARGWTQQQLASEMNYSASQVEKVERDVNFPTAEFAAAADAALKLEGLLGRIRADSLRQRAEADWLRSWRGILDQATALRAFNPLVVYGMLQTERYARAQLRGSDDPEQVDTRVAIRMERQRELFNRDRPPAVVALLDEAVLHRQVGDPAGMVEQLDQLTTCPAVVQVVPVGAETYLGLDGPFEIATVDGHDHVYVETPALGLVLDNPEVVSQIGARWQILLAEALPQAQSRELIAKAIDQWKAKC